MLKCPALIYEEKFMTNITLTVRLLQDPAPAGIDRTIVSVPIDAKTTMAKVKEFVSEETGIFPASKISLWVNEPIKKIYHKFSCWGDSIQEFPDGSIDLTYKDCALVLKAMKPYCGDFTTSRNGFIVYSYGPREFFFSVKQ